MKLPKHILSQVVFVLLAIGFLWCLSLPYLLMTNINSKDVGVTHDSQLKVWMETHGAEDIKKIFINFADNLVDTIKSSNRSRKDDMKDSKEELQALQIKMEAEIVKGQMKDQMIRELRSDKIHLQQQVSQLEEFLKLHVMKEEKKIQQISSEEKVFGVPIRGTSTTERTSRNNQAEQIREDENFPLPPMDGYPHCKEKLKWMKKMWRTDPCYSRHGVNGSLLSIIIYLSEIESWCPVLPGRVVPSPVKENTEIKLKSDPALIRESLKGLYPSLQNKRQLRWIHRRIQSMEEVWVEAGRSLSAKYNLTGRTAKQVLVHPGALTDESGFHIAEAAFSGGPLGEQVQWSDLISTLYILGHHLHLSASIPTLRAFLQVRTSGCPPQNSKVEPNLIYTDIVGLRQIQTVIGSSWIKYKCMFRILDVFGTEPDFNHPDWITKHHDHCPFGGLNMTLMQFYTMFPHTPDNTFLGFVVQHQLISKESEQFKTTKRQNQALVYGKRATYWQGKEAYVDVIHKYLDVHGTADHSAAIPSYVKNHGIIKGHDVQTLLRQSKVFVGLGEPLEGPGPLEALANGCAFLNPRIQPPLSSLNSEIFKGKPNIREVTSQHPYAEAIGEPYVWMVDIHNKTDVERALTAILNQTIEPYLPYEFSCEGMLQRVNTLVEKQDFCSRTKSWPPLSALQIVQAEAGTSCKKACQKVGLICEPAFFPNLNSVKNLAKYGVDCLTSEFSNGHLVYPAYIKSSKHCVFQSDPLLFSCVRSDQSLVRVCPCRDYIKDQIALCKACI